MTISYSRDIDPSLLMLNFLQKLLRGSGERSHAQLLTSFAAQEQQLREDFFRLASSSGKPRDLRWAGCVWLDSKALVRDPSSGLVTLFCGVNLSFEAVEGGDMEDVEAVSTIRDGSAVFHYQEGRWGTGGRVLFNMDPETATEVAASGQERIEPS